MKMRKTEILRNVFLLIFESQYELAATFLRFQEYYESPKFKGKAFSLEEYMDWYAKENGNFTYYQDWSGFNVPSSALTPFHAGRFKPLSKKEQKLLKLFPKSRQRFYLIGLQASDGVPTSETFQHELAHALFFIDPKYKRTVLELLEKQNTTRTERELIAAGYHPSVALDEIQAYLIAGIDDIDVHFSKSLRRLGEKFRSIFAERKLALQLK